MTYIIEQEFNKNVFEFSMEDVFGRTLQDGDLVVKTYSCDMSDFEKRHIKIYLLMNHDTYLYLRNLGGFRKEKLSSTKLITNRCVYKLNCHLSVRKVDDDFYAIENQDDLQIMKQLENLGGDLNIGDLVLFTNSYYITQSKTTYAVALGEKLFFTGKTIMNMDENTDTGRFYLKISNLTDDEKEKQKQILSVYQQMASLNLAYKRRNVLSVGDAFVYDNYFYLYLGNSIYLAIPAFSDYVKHSVYEDYLESVDKIYKQIINNNCSSEIIYHLLDICVGNLLNKTINHTFEKYKKKALESWTRFGIETLPLTKELKREAYYIGNYEVSISDELNVYMLSLLEVIEKINFRRK